MPQRRRLLVVGSQSLGRQVAHHARTWGGWDVAGFVDDFRPAGETTPDGPVLGRLADLPRLRDEGAFDGVFPAIGYRHMEFRVGLVGRLGADLPWATLVHPSCVVDPSASVGRACLLLAGCLLDAAARLADGVLLHPGCSVSHDSTIGEGSFLGPRVTVAGDATIGRGCFLGVGTTVSDSVRVADGVRTGAGTVVVRDLDAPALYVGAPARRIR